VSILSLNGVPVPKIEMIDEMMDLISEAKSKGPVTVVFSPMVDDLAMLRLVQE
jgi:hypothetical protein